MKRVLLLLPSGFEFFEASVFIDVIGWNLVVGDGSTELFTCGYQHVVKSTFNQRMLVDYVIEDVKALDFDALAIPGGFEEYGFYEEAYNERTANLIRDFKDQDKVIASICVGALPIGNSGVLVGKKATTYSKNPVRQATLCEFGALFQMEPIVVDSKIITSWDPSTATDVALLLLELLTSKSNADRVRNLMGFGVK